MLKFWPLCISLSNAIQAKKMWAHLSERYPWVTASHTHGEHTSAHVQLCTHHKVHSSLPHPIRSAIFTNPKLQISPERSQPEPVSLLFRNCNLIPCDTPSSNRSAFLLKDKWRLSVVKNSFNCLNLTLSPMPITIMLTKFTEMKINSWQEIRQYQVTCNVTYQWLTVSPKHSHFWAGRPSLICLLITGWG